MQKIDSFMLPQNFNETFGNEALSSIALTRLVAEKINELVEAYNNLNTMDLHWKQNVEGKVNAGVLYMKDNLVNSINDLFNYLKDSGEMSNVLVNVYKDKVYENTELLKGLNVIVTPEMYGAKGDGLTDDTEAIKTMLSTITPFLPVKNFVNETPCKDYTIISFKFTGNYLISEPIIFEDSYGLDISNLRLKASNNFVGDAMVVLKHITRNCKANNVVLNGNKIAKTCLWINDYTLTLDFNNMELTQFKEYGLYADGKGHEIKANNVKINQYEYGEKDSLSNLNTGVGIFLGEERHDNQFTNVIVNYCNQYALQVKGGTNTFLNSHFYTCDVLNEGRYNTFSNCYFDNSAFKTGGFFNLNESLLLKSRNDTSPFIYLMGENDENNWLFDTCNLNHNSFKAETQIDKPIDLGGMTVLPYFNTIGNTFYYVTPFTSHGRLGRTRNPWDEERMSYGDETSGYKIYGNLAIVWGYQTGNGFVSYPNGLELKETIHISFERQDNVNPNLIPWANTIKPNQFWANSIGEGSTVKWVVIGVVK